MKTAKQLAADLNRLNPTLFPDVPAESRDVSKCARLGDETYGKQSFVYVYLPSDKNYRASATRKLEALGHKVNRDYSPGSQVLEVRVRFFRGTRWNV